MNKIDQLFVRACKSECPEKRVLSVYRRFYVQHHVPESYAYHAQITARICEKYELCSLLELVSATNPENKWQYSLDKDVCYHQFVFRVLVRKIRFADTSKFEGLIAPAKFRTGGKK